ncbi:hypothetical protein EDI_190880 [Entamoeba dispar SAW760]|uniref:Uncharacterized protein n=1 Tax=Entamoeba dispar (strain ATCC PRA-260 / SAW760) TaxID=370354 RepID=B0E656_ENTDS|nr:uncharacterized protein EDI_190880 [Entamoeba dispar SAW760]EDR30029.1 hypothetical protein EDI_190880 [Entamoeba dispar SAW760]|eukprot:EDR30029.1 hypothetical protein EDI_190880 [Entamoeba dispar SAW760]
MEQLPFSFNSKNVTILFDSDVFGFSKNYLYKSIYKKKKVFFLIFIEEMNPIGFYVDTLFFNDWFHVDDFSITEFMDQFNFICHSHKPIYDTLIFNKRNKFIFGVHGLFGMKVTKKLSSNIITWDNERKKSEYPTIDFFKPTTKYPVTRLLVLLQNE